MLSIGSNVEALTDSLWIVVRAISPMSLVFPFGLSLACPELGEGSKPFDKLRANG
jgi:hypothetical protein